MILSLTTACDRTLDAIAAAPPLVFKLLDPTADPASFVPPAPRVGFIARLFGAKAAPAAPRVVLPELELGPDDAIGLYLDKAWHGIHFLLTGSDWEGEMPRAFLLRGGTELKGVDTGYGPPRLMRAEETAGVAKCLSGISREELAARFDPVKMMELDIYPTIWARPDDDALGYLLDHFDELKSFVSTARDKRLGLVLAMS